jgi:hypothetical protein
MDIRTIREQMLADGDIDRGQFEAMELRDGRLDNGANVLALFFTKDALVAPMLQIDKLSDPLSINENDKDDALTAIDEQLQQVNQTLITARTDSTRTACFKAIAALTKLYEKYNSKKDTPEPVEYNEMGVPVETDHSEDIVSAFIDMPVQMAQIPAKPLPIATGNHPSATNPLKRNARGQDKTTPKNSETATPSLKDEQSSTERDNKPL